MVVFMVLACLAVLPLLSVFVDGVDGFKIAHAVEHQQQSSTVLGEHFMRFSETSKHHQLHRLSSQRTVSRKRRYVNNHRELSDKWLLEIRNQNEHEVPSDDHLRRSDLSSAQTPLDLVRDEKIQKVKESVASFESLILAGSQWGLIREVEPIQQFEGPATDVIKTTQKTPTPSAATPKNLLSLAVERFRSGKCDWANKGEVEYDGRCEKLLQLGTPACGNDTQKWLVLSQKTWTPECAVKDCTRPGASKLDNDRVLFWHADSSCHATTAIYAGLTSTSYFSFSQIVVGQMYKRCDQSKHPDK